MAGPFLAEPAKKVWPRYVFVASGHSAHSLALIVLFLCLYPHMFLLYSFFVPISLSYKNMRDIR